MPKEFTSEPNAQESAVIAGRNAVTEALKKARPIDCIYILKGADRGSVGKIIALAKERGVPVKDAAAQKLDALCGGVVHQGVAAMAACHDFSTMLSGSRSDIHDIVRRAHSIFIMFYYN